ncbi:lipid-A-disaccharide synthase [Planctomycetes bacterium Poly30]|uniref:Lipid-A-disaccharide synthase n=1 Tax=Saltatorellus ferox TaxID=2528018 RepID=A0A518EZT0_9BACT|nr:lipid-A-disaccharide synthase [Planctomycetes bacterium Poly30]
MSWLEALGWTGNGFYFSRFFVQWWQSERAGKSVAPPIFWWLSVAGAATLGTYAYLAADSPLFVGYAITFVIYVRNVSIAYLGERAGRIGAVPALLLGLGASLLLLRFGTTPAGAESASRPWLIAAFLGQAFFSMRFVIQWYATEKLGHAYFPRSFWWFSLIGNVLLLAYAIQRGDPVFIAGFSAGPFVQIRNLMLPPMIPVLPPIEKT